MESLQEREIRIGELERRRRERRAGASVASSDGGRREIAPGRGDLTTSSWDLFPTARGLQTIGGSTVSFSRLYRTQPYIGAAVLRMLRWSIRVPLKVYRREGDDPAARHRLRPGEHPLADAIDAQDGRSAAQLAMQLLGPFLVHGNSVTRVDSGRDDSVRFTPKDWRFSRPLGFRSEFQGFKFGDELQGFKFDVDDPTVACECSIDNVLHIADFAPDSPIGCSPLEQLGVTLQIEDAAQRFVRSTLRNGGKPPSAIVATDEWFGLEETERQEVLDELRADLIALHVGPENAGRPVILPPGLDWKPLAHQTVEAELMDQRRIAKEEICGVYQIPPPMLGILDKATYSNIETQRAMVYTDCLGPPLILIEQAINTQIIRRLLGETDVFVEHDFGAVLRGNRLEEIQALREAIASALFTPNEGRQVLNQAKSDVPGMDDFYLPANNLQPVGSSPTPPVQFTTSAARGRSSGEVLANRMRADGTVGPAPALHVVELPAWQEDRVAVVNVERPPGPEDRRRDDDLSGKVDKVLEQLSAVAA